ncbi:MAG: stimulus-sensing domain-containing protein [Magnetovibrionaceae bacterium]
MEGGTPGQGQRDFEQHGPAAKRAASMRLGSADGGPIPSSFAAPGVKAPAALPEPKHRAKSRNRKRTIRATRQRFSPLTRRILAVNVLALLSLVVGILYLGQYRQSLIDQELAALRVQGEMFAVALAESAVQLEGTPSQRLLRETAVQMIRRLVQTTGTRARLFAPNGALVADSHLMVGLGGLVQVQDLPPPGAMAQITQQVLDLYDRVAGALAGDERTLPYREKWIQGAGDYEETVTALSGEPAEMVRTMSPSGLMLSSAVPIQRYKQVLGAVMLSKDSRDMDEALYEVRVNILRLFAAVMCATILISIYLAGTIARPIRRLAVAAERIRRGRNRAVAIPELPKRDDEIGELARALRDMTEELWSRMDATERFAADVAHEIKNPLTSLRSAVETAARLKDPDQQRKLMSIIQEDVARLDRLISDISDASRLDAELSRGETERIDIAALLETLVDIERSTRDDGPALALDMEQNLAVMGLDGRLAQVFRNLVGNAISFSPPGGTVTLQAFADRGDVVVTVTDEGPGIPPGKEKKIFERFYSERPEGEKFGTHSGLGLNISQQIIQAHQGWIEAENRVDRSGARFQVRLPLAGPDDGPDVRKA